MYNFSTIIIIFIVLIGIFLACRELMCWYYKINKIVSLMEEQNNLIKQQLGMTSNSNLLPTQFIPTHCVKLPNGTEVLGLRNKPDAKIESFIKIPNGTEVQHIDTGDDVIFKEIKAPWFFVRTKDDIRGWCFSGILEKI